jgi:hypothetical protein
LSEKWREREAGLHLQHQMTPREATARSLMYLDSADNDELSDDSKVMSLLVA